MLTNEPNRQEVIDGQMAIIPPSEWGQWGRPSVENLIAEGCRLETNGDVTRVVGTGSGLVMRETVLRTRFLQGV